MFASLPLITIVTPSLNQAAFIGRAIDSVLDQNDGAIELMVCDGGSTDNTLDVLRRYGKRIAWVSEPDNGQSAAINKGWQKANGAVIAYLNADDAYLPNAVNAALNFLTQHPEIDIVYGDCD